MKDIFLPILIAVLGVSGLLYGAYQTADVKGTQITIVVSENVMKSILQSMEHFQNN